MINLTFGPNTFLGILLAFGVLLLYGIRLARPQMARDEDIFFSTLGIMASFILIMHGWRLDPVLLFSQVLIISLILALIWENIRLRGVIVSNLKKK
uniref:Conserved hypothetical plastid protein n=1 Tax=Olisthodiscus luteus TaxID=83000 RepID=A0A7U0KT47_OLILU|nr:conserved hypothetical plastid protein [Olisthodiscus luteus]QQW50564.1 conserved hypothetical plastid protein [Olisthodiscus luteus]